MRSKRARRMKSPRGQVLMTRLLCPFSIKAPRGGSGKMTAMLARKTGWTSIDTGITMIDPAETGINVISP